MELWERAAALTELDELLRASSDGGRVVVVAGEAGIGKSVLVTEFARRCGARARVLWGACDRLVTPRALGPLHDIARHAGGALAERLDAGAPQEEIFAAFLDELAGPRQRPRPVVVVEDVHWADEATLDWVAFVGRRIGRLPALLVLTHRDDEVGPDHPLRGVLAALPTATLRRMAVPPLTPECVAEQARRVGRDAGMVRRLAGGNPLLVTELLKSADRAVPATVQDLILDRLRSLGPAARDLAHLVAVVPTRAEVAFVADATDELEECVDGGVLVHAGEGAAYRHELLRGAVEDSLAPHRRSLMHRRALEILSTVEGVDPGRLVHHALGAGDDGAVLRHGRRAGAEAARQGAYREAAAHYRAASAHAEALPAPDRADLWEEYALQAYLAGLSYEGLAARRAALAVREGLGQAERAGENLRWISRLEWMMGRAVMAREAAAGAVTVLETLPPGRHLAMAYSNQSQLHMLADEHEQAIAWGERARELADRIGDVETSIHATVNVASSRVQIGERDARAALAEAHRAADAAGLVDDACRALINLASLLVDDEDYIEGAPVVDRALDYATAHHLDGYARYLLGKRAMVRFAGADWDGALAAVDEALRHRSRAVIQAVPALIVRARIQSARGDDHALSTLDEALRHVEHTGEIQRVGPVATARSEFFCWAGDLDRAAAEARRGLALAPALGRTFYVGELAYRLWCAGVTAPAEIGVGAQPYQLMMNGEWKAAAAEWSRRGSELGRVWALAEGDEAAVAEALRVLDELGATAAARWLRARLRQRGITRVPRGPRRATSANPAGLTPRQVDVLVLLAEGLSNAEIAERLSLSAKTVDHHISAILGKLGVANRGQAAAVAYRLNLMPASPPPAGTRP